MAGETETREVRVTVRFTRSEREMLEGLAEEDQRKLADEIRILAFAEVRRRMRDSVAQ